MHELIKKLDFSSYFTLLESYNRLSALYPDKLDKEYVMSLFFASDPLKASSIKNDGIEYKSSKGINFPSCLCWKKYFIIQRTIFDQEMREVSRMGGNIYILNDYLVVLKPYSSQGNLLFTIYKSIEPEIKIEVEHQGNQIDLRQIDDMILNGSHILYSQTPRPNNEYLEDIAHEDGWTTYRGNIIPSPGQWRPEYKKGDLIVFKNYQNSSEDSNEKQLYISMRGSRLIWMMAVPLYFNAYISNNLMYITSVSIFDLYTCNDFGKGSRYLLFTKNGYLVFKSDDLSSLMGF